MTTYGEIVLHGHRVTYREDGAGDDRPVVVLLHGIAGSSATWQPLIDQLAGRVHLIAPDLLGHGTSAKPRGDYSLGAYASGVRDLTAALGHDRVTIVGHSLGGGIAMQFAYQFPERTERLALVCSGGLGREVNPILRAATLPGAELVLPLLSNRQIVRLGELVGRLAAALPLPLSIRPNVTEVARGFASLAETQARSAFVHTARAVIDVAGQRVDARDRLYLTEVMPTLIVWGEKDRIIPVTHGRRAHQLAPGSRLEVFEASGHFPQLDEPARLATVLLDFLASTERGDAGTEQLTERLRVARQPA